MLRCIGFAKFGFLNKLEGGYVMKRLEVIANISVIVASVVLVIFLGYQTWERHKAAGGPAKRLIGTTLHLPGVDFASRRKTLVIAISTSCRFCEDSVPFYRKLAENTNVQTHLVAVLPQPQAVAQSYVRNSIATSIQTISAPLNSIGVNSTPTLLLVDADGKVKNAWLGKLDDSGQKQVQSQL
jgi:hypothetical protein